MKATIVEAAGIGTATGLISGVVYYCFDHRITKSIENDIGFLNQYVDSYKYGDDPLIADIKNDIQHLEQLKLVSLYDKVTRRRYIKQIFADANIDKKK